MKPSLLQYTKEELTGLLASNGYPTFRAKQIWGWIYVKGVTEFSQMANVSKDIREWLEENYTIARPSTSEDLTSTDGTRKWLLKMEDGREVETVFIPEEDRGALCVSSQVGCTLACTFCHTGTMKLVRNLTVDEIVGQWMLARDREDEWNKSDAERRVTNIVLMGMGEPLYNYENVKKAMLILMDQDGVALSKRRITLSTSGIVPAIEACGRDLEVNLAISLHATNDKLRNEIVPINKKYPLKDLMQTCRDYPGASNSRRITFEYVMLKDVNDSEEDAKQLVELLKGVHAKVNLIPFNPWPNSPYECSSNNRIHAFGRIVMAAGFSSPIRKTRGQDIFAACGQLKSDSIRKKGEKVKL
ncbi:MAG: 23S rRNA (adenine(2503)-C(2))-methyltransferase RlmN [Rickettsiales bacterium]|nr:23S rRNA (adenine(2503)-C(2))-methyltransferase RlmN [Rickettsiales bacterium]